MKLVLGDYSLSLSLRRRSREAALLIPPEPWWHLTMWGSRPSHFIMIPNTKRHPNNKKTDQLPISEVITRLPRPYLNIRLKKVLNRGVISWTRYLLKALVRWATGKRLTDRLPKLSLITLDRPDIYTGRRVTNSRFQFRGTQGVFFWFDMGKFNFFS